jgi:hypothetical protein
LGATDIAIRVWDGLAIHAPYSSAFIAMLSRLISALLLPLIAGAFAADAAVAQPAPNSLQSLIDRQPGQMVFVPPGEYRIDHALRITRSGAGLWGAARIVQTNAAEPILEVNEANDVRVEGLTLTRAEGAMETHSPGILVKHCTNPILSNVRVIDNWSDGNGVRFEGCTRVVVRDCLILNYSRVSIDDRTATPFLGYAFNCTEGTGLNIVNVKGALLQNNRIIERRLLPTPELQKKYDLGKIVKKNAVRGENIAQESWDSNYVNIWRQGAALHVGSGETSDCVQILGNYIENTQQGLDVHCDHVIVANNIINNAPHGIKSMHGSRNILIVGNQFMKNDLFGIGLMQGTASHVAGRQGNGRGPAPVGPNVDGYSIVAHNIISDFGRGLSHWLWPVGHNIGPAPLQFGGKALADSPVLRRVIVEGNVVGDPGALQLPPEAPRYRYAVRIEAGNAAPEEMLFADNLFDRGLDGVATDSARTGVP